MARYEAAKPDTKRRGRYWRWGVWDTRKSKFIAIYGGEFAKSRAEGHASFQNEGGFGDWSEVFRRRSS